MPILAFGVTFFSIFLLDKLDTLGSKTILPRFQEYTTSNMVSLSKKLQRYFNTGRLPSFYDRIQCMKVRKKNQLCSTRIIQMSFCLISVPPAASFIGLDAHCGTTSKHFVTTKTHQTRYETHTALK